MSETMPLSPINQLPVDLWNTSGNRLEGKLQAVGKADDNDRKAELKKVAQEFEAVFITHLLKVMRETIEESGLLGGGFGKSIYTEMLDQEVSLDMARHGTLGISNLICKKLSAAAESGEKKSENAPVSRPSPDPSATPQSSPEERGTDQKSECEITDFQLPVHGQISSAFGLRKDPFSRQLRFHKGLDLAAPEGMTVVAALPGKVIAAGYESGYGNAVSIQHAGGIQTKYAHLASINVKVGDAIGAQDTLGAVGKTGHSTGPHLHFEVIRMGKPVDPTLSYNADGFHPTSGNLKTGS